MYLAGADVAVLVEHFDADPIIAWLVGRGPGQWIAQPRHEQLSRRMGLWHIPSGPLPLLASDWRKGQEDWVTDPWRGWTERRAGADPTVPYFGPGHPGVYWLTLRAPASLNPGEQIGMSTVEWIGNRYRSIEEPAPATEAHWKALRRWMAKVARRIPRAGDVDGPHREVFAFPAALEAITSGAHRVSNPW